MREPGVAYFKVRCFHGSFVSPTHRKQNCGRYSLNLICTESIAVCRSVSISSSPENRCRFVGEQEGISSDADRRQDWAGRGVGWPSSMPQNAALIIEGVVWIIVIFRVLVIEFKAAVGFILGSSDPLSEKISLTSELASLSFSLSRGPARRE